MTEKRTKGYEYINQSRGYKTKGNSYKDRYVEVICPECGHNKAYKDSWRTRDSMTCMKRSCRHKWYIKKEIEPIDVQESDTEE